MQERNKKGIPAFGVATAVALVACGGHHSGSNNLYSTSVARMAKLETGLSLYLNDFDDTLPNANGWMEALTPYVKDPTAFRSPSVAALGFGYAYNSAIAGQAYTQIANPDQTLSFFDSTDLNADATEPTSTMPSPGRYSGKNTLGYVDGRTQDETAVPNAPLTPAQVSLSRVKQLELGVLVYANDYDDDYPQSGAWMDGLTPYVKNPELFHSPAVEALTSTDYGYALNSAVAGQSASSILIPSTTFGVFDSTDLLRNATDPTSTLPSPGRYSGKNTIGFLDGHAAVQ